MHVAVYLERSGGCHSSDEGLIYDCTFATKAIACSKLQLRTLFCLLYALFRLYGRNGLLNGLSRRSWCLVERVEITSLTLVVWEWQKDATSTGTRPSKCTTLLYATPLIVVRDIDSIDKKTVEVTEQHLRRVGSCQQLAIPKAMPTSFYPRASVPRFPQWIDVGTFIS